MPEAHPERVYELLRLVRHGRQTPASKVPERLHDALVYCRNHNPPLVETGIRMRFGEEAPDGPRGPLVLSPNNAGEMALAALDMQRAAPTSAGQKGSDRRWRKLIDAEQLTGISRGTIARAADNGQIEDNGQTGRARRIEMGSFADWALRRAEKGETEENADAVRRKLRAAGL